MNVDCGVNDTSRITSVHIFVALKSSGQLSYIIPLSAIEIQCRELFSPRWDNLKKSKK